MKTLTILTTLNCPLECSFCYNPKSQEQVDIQELELFLQNNISHFDEIKISGGEPMLLNKLYFDTLVDMVKKYSSNITIVSYPITLNNYRDDVNYELSYDFLGKPRALEVWENLITFPKKFDLKILVTPKLLKTFTPNLIFNKLSLLPNINSVEFKEYFREKSTMWNFDSNIYKTFLQLVLTSRLSLPYINLNKEKINFLNDKPSKITEKEFNDEIYYYPDNKLYVKSFDENDIITFNEISIEDIDTYKDVKPNNYNFYSKEMCDWSLLNATI